MQNITEIMLMAEKGTFEKALFGAITDVNVWNRSLSDDEVEDFLSCSGLEGNYQAWSTDKFPYQRALVEEGADMGEICPLSTKTLILGNSRIKRDLQETTQFCSEALNGRMAVGEARGEVEAMLAENRLDGSCQYFYLGFTDIKGRDQIHTRC